MIGRDKGLLEYNTEQDGPSLESSSYLNVSLRYPGPWDPGTFGTLVLGTFLQHLLILPLYIDLYIGLKKLWDG